MHAVGDGFFVLVFTLVAVEPLVCRAAETTLDADSYELPADIGTHYAVVAEAALDVLAVVEKGLGRGVTAVGVHLELVVYAVSHRRTELHTYINAVHGDV